MIGAFEPPRVRSPSHSFSRRRGRGRPARSERRRERKVFPPSKLSPAPSILCKYRGKLFSGENYRVREGMCEKMPTEALPLLPFPSPLPRPPLAQGVARPRFMPAEAMSSRARAGPQA